MKSYFPLIIMCSIFSVLRGMDVALIPTGLDLSFSNQCYHFDQKGNVCFPSS